MMRLMLLLFWGLIACAPNRTQKASYLYVQLAQNGSLSESSLVLHGVDERVLYFSDRPLREAGHISVSEFVQNWHHGKHGFAEIPPNAAIEIRDGDKRIVFVVELLNPRLDVSSKTLTYDVKNLNKTIDVRNFEHVSLFIDDQSGPRHCDESDQKVAIYPANKQFWQQLNACAKSAMGGADKTAQCLLVDYPNLSEGCAQSFGDMTQCIAKHCMFACMFNSFGNKCTTCASENCDPSLFSGVPKAQLPL